MIYPGKEEFLRLASECNVIPVFREMAGDMETPVSLFKKVAKGPESFLLESVEGGEKWGRYTFLGSESHMIFRVKGEDVLIQKNGEVRTHKHGGDPMRFLKDLLHIYRPVPLDGLPRFYGGAVGFLGYDMVRYFERLPAEAKEELMTDDATFLITDTLMIFDNVRHTIKVVACVLTEGRGDLGAVYGEAINKIDQMIEMLRAPVEKGERMDRKPHHLNEPIEIGATRITAFDVYHSSPCLGYKIEHGGKKFVFCTDHELRHGPDPDDPKQKASEEAED